MSKNLRKTKASDPEQASFATAKETLADKLGNIDVLPKTDAQCAPCGSCPPANPRCPTQAKKVTSRMVIPESEIASSIGGPLSIDQIEVGTVTIPNLKLRDFAGDFTYASCKAKNVELEITLSISTTFTGDLDLPWPLCWSDFCWGVSGGVDFDAFIEKHSLGDIEFQNGSFSMLSPTMNMGPFSMTSEPIQKTTVGEVTTEDVKMKCTSIPLENPLGMGLGICLPFQNPMGPNNVITDETNIKRMDSMRISSTRVGMKNISALNINIPSVTTKPFEAKSTTPVQVTTSKKMYGAGVTLSGDAERAHIQGTLTLRITSMIMRVKGGLEFKDVKGTVTTASAISDKLDMNLVLKGIKIKGLNLCGMKIPDIEVEI